jgi:hypothetical protein
MKFTKELVAFANTLIRERGMSRSLAYQTAKVYCSSDFQFFQHCLNMGFVMKVRYKADKHLGEVQERQALSLKQAISMGLYNPVETDGEVKHYPHLTTYFDVDKGEVRKFKILNFVGWVDPRK